MDKQKSYGENYDKTKPRHSFSTRFVLLTLLFCILAVILCCVFVR